MLMKPLGQVYREHAVQERTQAADATLANVKALHERAATRWVELAELAERPGLVSRRARPAIVSIRDGAADDSEGT